MIYVIAASLSVIAGLIYMLNRTRDEIKRLEDLIAEKKLELLEEVAKARKDSKFRSSAANWGFTIENFVPFIDSFPIPPEDVNFLGKPIDYVGFTHTDSKTKCEVHFIEVKSGQSLLSQKQRNIKLAIQQGRVRWHEVRVDANSVENM